MKKLPDFGPMTRDEVAAWINKNYPKSYAEKVLESYKGDLEEAVRDLARQLQAAEDEAEENAGRAEEAEDELEAYKDALRQTQKIVDGVL